MTQKDPNTKEGMRVKVISMIDDPNPVPAGTEGTIVLIDDMGTLHVKWDDGRRLGLIPGVDKYMLEPETLPNVNMDDAFDKIEEADSGKSAIKKAINQTPGNVQKSMPKVSGLSNTNTSKEFKKAGIKDVKVESNEIKGGKADKLTIKDLAKKHKVSVEDIKKEIKIGVKIEKEHVGNDVNKAKEIAMDHISEFSDYYSNKRYGVLASEKGLKKDEKKVKKKRGKTDYMTSTAGGVSTGAYTGNAWGSGPLMKNNTVRKPGPLTKEQLVKEIAATYHMGDNGVKISKKYDDTKHESWADINRDGWKWNDTPQWEGGEIIDPLAKIETAWDDENLDISKEWDSSQKKKQNLKKEDVLKMVGMRLLESKYEIVNDEHLDSIKDNFKPPALDDEEETIEETTTFGSVWGSNGPPVGPAFAAKQGQWRAGKNPIWKGGKIVQKVENSGVLNPITETRIKDVNSLQVGNRYKLMIPNYDEGGTEMVNVEVIKKDKNGYVFKDLDTNTTFNRTFQHLKNEEIISEANKVKFNPNGKVVQIKKKCTKYPYCNQGAIDNPLELSSSVKQHGSYVESVLSDETIKNIHEISKELGKPFIEIYNMVKKNIR